jgi:hypothetical protein
VVKRGLGRSHDLVDVGFDGDEGGVDAVDRGPKAADGDHLELGAFHVAADVGAFCIQNGGAEAGVDVVASGAEADGGGPQHVEGMVLLDLLLGLGVCAFVQKDPEAGKDVKARDAWPRSVGAGDGGPGGLGVFVPLAAAHAMDVDGGLVGVHCW